MAAAEKIKALLQSFGDEDDTRFYTTAMQIAAAEAKKGHTKLAEELKHLIEKIKRGFGSKSNEEAVDVVATLPRIVEFKPEGSLHCFVNIGIIKDNCRAVATELHCYIFDGACRRANQFFAHFGGTGEGEFPDKGMMGQLGAHFGRVFTGQDIKDTWRKARFVSKGCQCQCGKGGVFGRL